MRVTNSKIGFLGVFIYEMCFKTRWGSIKEIRFGKSNCLCSKAYLVFTSPYEFIDNFWKFDYSVVLLKGK